MLATGKGAELRRNPLAYAWMGGCLLPFSYPYGWAMRTRNLLYDRNLLAKRRLPRPVVCVGNLTWGGTGKTPIVRWMAGKLADEGYSLALLSRGYGRTAEGLVLSRPGELGDSRLLGDEPAMLKEAMPDLWIGVHRDRWLAGNEILKWGDVDLFVMDDGFQHRRLSRELDLVVMRSKRTPLERRLIPSGSLREPLNGIARAQGLLINETDGGAPKELLDLGERFDCGIFRFTMEPGRLLRRGAEGDDEIAEPFGGRAVLLSGIGSPDSFRATAEAAGVVCLEHLRFPDHHWFRESDLALAAEAVSRCEADFLLTTEKDWQRMRQTDISLPVVTLGLDVRFREREDEALLDLIRERL